MIERLADKALVENFEFCPELAELLRTRCVVGRNGKLFEGLSSLSTVNNLRTLRRLMAENHPERTLEIGFAFGASALLFSASHRDLGSSPKAQHTVVDPLQESVWDSLGLMAVEHAGLSGYLDYRPVPSAIALPKLLEGGERFGLIYIDGSHLFEDVFVDAYFAVRLLSENGIVAFDDSSDSHVAKVLRFIRTTLHGAVQELDLARCRTKRKRFHYWLAKRFGKVQMTAFRRVRPVEREWNARFQAF